MAKNKQLEKIVQKQIDDLVANDFLYFLLDKWHISSGEHFGEPYSLASRPYMLDIIKDDFEFQAIMKSAQCGISEIEVAKAIWKAIYGGVNVLYTMPAGEQMQQFVDSRPRNAILHSEELSKKVTGTLNLKKFSLNNHQIYFRGVQKRRQIITVDVSTLLADECDEYEEGTLNTLNKRLGASENPFRVYFSTPSFHSTGISLYYYGLEGHERGSDQRVWTIKCEKCGKWNEDLLWHENTLDKNIDFIKNSNYEPDVVVICRYCRREMDRLSTNAQWVAKYPANTNYLHGYHISKLFSPIANLNQMMLDSRNPLKEQEFYNSDLGLPYEPIGARITDGALDKCRGNYNILVTTSEPGFLGFDVGQKIHAIVSQKSAESDKPQIVTVLELDGWSDMSYVMKDFNIKCTVLDANPDKKEALDFQKEFDNVWLSYYMQHLERTPNKYVLNKDDGIIHVHRTLMMQVVSDLIAQKEIILPLDIRRVRDYYEHMKAPVKAQKQNMQGDWVIFYPKTKSPDHFYHAMIYNMCAWMVKPRAARFSIRKVFFQ